LVVEGMKEFTEVSDGTGVPGGWWTVGG